MQWAFYAGNEFVAALLLLVMKTEEDAFWMLAVLLENVLFSESFAEYLRGCHLAPRARPLQLRKQCPCQLNGTCCEKYCGCAESCENRFRGCHCATRQCCSRQCPCFAAGRECDPDVCCNCWRGCGDGKLAYPQQPEEKGHYTCHNMKLLLKQQQRPISHREADKRGKIYGRENSSFLFNLNDQGDKLKFANHSPNPNCYAKVIMVAGDHRVGIFAKERIMAGEELFYDYLKPGTAGNILEKPIEFLDDYDVVILGRSSLSLKDSLSVRWDSLPKRASKLFFATRIVEEFEQKVDGHPGQLTSRDVPALIAFGTELLQEQVLSCNFAGFST
ncbi:hypothetical protein R1sor_000176 [Riccia sorocarpa]|uniref:[Histone H3]-lysine(27) N-trimethyltransferase n=1 Tax=Riccia sorocarpa TaxID=122646 RepID=A0ABD3GUV8_9MARC